jgi:hypothetical protein
MKPPQWGQVGRLGFVSKFALRIEPPKASVDHQSPSTTPAGTTSDKPLMSSNTTAPIVASDDCADDAGAESIKIDLNVRVIHITIQSSILASTNINHDMIPQTG